MKLFRRRFLQLAGAAVACGALPRSASALAYPVRPVHWVVGFPAGGGNDIVARLIGQWLSERMGQQFIIENRPGAATNIAAEAVVSAPPDGYTLLLTNTAGAINMTLYDKLRFNFIRDIAPVAGLVSVPLVMVVHPSFPATTVAEFIAYAKANRGKINMASAGNGSAPHVAGELFKMMTGVDMLHVPYRGEQPALTDLLGAQVQVLFATAPASIAYIKAGKLRALAVTTATRSQALPEVPTVADTVPGYEANASFGVGVPAKTPLEIIETLNQQINAALADPGIKARLADLAVTALPGSPADYGALIAAETEKWGKVVKFSGAKPD